MASPLVSDALWSIIAPLLPRGGRPRVPDRAALKGILFVLRTGIQWEMLPLEMGCGSSITCWRRLRDWQAAGIWDALHRELLHRLHAADRIDWSRACIDSMCDDRIYTWFNINCVELAPLNGQSATCSAWLRAVSRDPARHSQRQPD